MLSLITLTLIQFFFCLFFFLYFRHKITEQLRLKEYKQEMDELIITFNRQAERHISYLETLLEHDLLKNHPPPKPQPNVAPSGKIENSIAEKDTFPQAPEISPLHLNKLSSSFKPQKNPIPTPPQVAHAFYAQFSNLDNPGSNGSTVLTNKKPHPSSKKKHEHIKNGIQTKILRLYQTGMTPQQIAQQLLISTAEVKLILKLKGTL